MKNWKNKINKSLSNKQKVMPPQPISPPEFDVSKTIRDWDPLNFSSDETVCALCGKKDECECYDKFYCPCGKKNKNCEWPESIYCPCRGCGKKYTVCLCDKPDRFTEAEWLEIKGFKYRLKYDWEKEAQKFSIAELERFDKEDE